MEERDTHLIDALDALGQESRQNLGPHPSPAELEAFQERRLASPEEQRVRDHVTLCPRCADLVLALANAAAEKRSESTSGKIERGWQRLEEELAEGPANLRLRPKGGVPRGRVPWWLAVAASILLGAVGIVLGSLTNGLGSRTGVWANPLVLELDPVGADSVRGTGDKEEPQDGPLVLVLNSAAEETYPSYELLILAGERLVLRKDGLRRTKAGSVWLSIDRDFLAPGRYDLHLMGRSGRERTLVEAYEAVIPPPP